jgi:hypothetical protein
VQTIEKLIETNQILEAASVSGGDFLQQIHELKLENKRYANTRVKHVCACRSISPNRCTTLSWGDGDVVCGVRWTTV